MKHPNQNLVLVNGQLNKVKEMFPVVEKKLIC